MTQAFSIIIGVVGFILCVALLINGFVQKRKALLARNKEENRENGSSGGKG
jgi:hypothetical protein